MEQRLRHDDNLPAALHDVNPEVPILEPGVFLVMPALRWVVPARFLERVTADQRTDGDGVVLLDLV